MSSKNVEFTECCNVISKSVQSIIRWSFNENFREQCFALLEVRNSLEAESKVRTQLTEVTKLTPIKLNNSKKRIKHKVKRKCKDEVTGIEVPDKHPVSLTGNPKFVNLKVPEQELRNWGLGEIKVADIDDWN